MPGETCGKETVQLSCTEVAESAVAENVAGEGEKSGREGDEGGRGKRERERWEGAGERDRQYLRIGITEHVLYMIESTHLQRYQTYPSEDRRVLPSRPWPEQSALS